MPKFIRTFEPVESKEHIGYYQIIIDGSTKGCEFAAKHEPVYTTGIVPFLVSGKRIYCQVNLLDTYVDKSAYWLIYCSFHLDELFIWVDKKRADQATVTKIAKGCMKCAVAVLTGMHETNLPINDLAALYAEETLPFARVLEYGELPNGVMASFLKVDVEEILSTFTGMKINTKGLPTNMDRAVIEEIKKGEKQQKEKSEKQKRKEAARLERHQKSKNQQKK